MKNKIVKVIFSPEAEKAYLHLVDNINSKLEKSILNSLNNKIGVLKSNIHYGDPIAKSLIPLEYKIKYAITNLFRIGLSNYWRMLYTLTGEENKNEIIIFILDVMDHKSYDKKLGYKYK